MKKSILILVFLTIFSNVYANKDKVFKKNYKNVEVIIQAADYTETMNSTLIIAKITSELSKDSNFKDKIKLLFLESHFDEDLIFSYTDKKVLVIRFKLKAFNISKCLNVIEYSINNANNLNQDKIFFLNLYVNSNQSTRLTKKYYRPKEIKELNKSTYFNYYYQNNKYHFFRSSDNKETVVTSVEKLDDFFPINSDLLFIFTDKDNLSVIDKSNATNVFIENNKSSFYSPVTVKSICESKVAIIFPKTSPNNNRVMIYLLDKYILIQDIENCK